MWRDTRTSLMRRERPSKGIEFGACICIYLGLEYMYIRHSVYALTLALC